MSADEARWQVYQPVDPAAPAALRRRLTDAGEPYELRAHEPARHARHLAALWSLPLDEAIRATLFYASPQAAPPGPGSAPADVPAPVLVLVPADRKIAAPRLRELLGRRRAARLTRRPRSREGRLARAPRGAGGPPGGARPLRGPPAGGRPRPAPPAGRTDSGAGPFAGPLTTGAAAPGGRARGQHHRAHAPAPGRGHGARPVSPALQSPKGGVALGRQRKTPGGVTLRGRERCPGGDLLSHDLSVAVSSALGRFTTVCGMGTGGTAPLRPPGPPDRTRTLRAFARPPAQRAISTAASLQPQNWRARRRVALDAAQGTGQYLAGGVQLRWAQAGDGPPERLPA